MASGYQGFEYAMGFGAGGWLLPLAGFGFVAILLWSLLWKGLALWHAGQRGQPWWFVILLVVNTVSILEIIYLFAVTKVKFADLFTVHRHHE